MEYVISDKRSLMVSGSIGMLQSLIIKKNEVERPIKESSFGPRLFGQLMLSSDREWTDCEHISPVVKRAMMSV
jgi:hypothetical protein